MASFYPDLYQTALDLLIKAREDAGLSVDDLAARFGPSGDFVTSYEAGQRLLDPAEFIAIARAIGVDPYELLRRAEGAEKPALARQQRPVVQRQADAIDVSEGRKVNSGRLSIGPKTRRSTHSLDIPAFARASICLLVSSTNRGAAFGPIQGARNTFHLEIVFDPLGTEAR
jgi:transcriptional regulator with XRE-family HTH domain